MAARRDKGTGTIFRRKDGRYIGGIEIPTADGHRRRKTVSSMRRDVVVRRLAQLRKDVESGRIAHTPNMTLAKYLQDWLRLAVRPAAAPKTFTWYEQAVRCHIVPHIGSRRLDKLSAADVRLMHEAIGSGSSAQQAHVTLAAALAQAVRDGILSRNVAALVGKPKHHPAERGAFTLAQAQQIIRAAIDDGDQMWAARVIAAFLTGARPGELLGLRWDYVDLDAGTMTLAWQLQLVPSEHGCTPDKPCGLRRAGACPAARLRIPRGYLFQPCQGGLVFVPTKTRTARVVPLAAPLWEVLRQLALTPGDNPHNLVFHHPDGRPFDPKDDYRRWKTLLRKQKGLPANIVPYSSRHTTATILRELGVGEDTRMSILGHSTATSHRQYVHPDQIQEDRAALARLDQLVRRDI